MHSWLPAVQGKMYVISSRNYPIGSSLVNLKEADITDLLCSPLVEINLIDINVIIILSCTY